MLINVISLIGQGKFLETKLNAFSGFNDNLKDFVMWLAKVEMALPHLDELGQNSQGKEGSAAGEFRKPAKVRLY